MELIPARGYLIEGQSICVDHHDSSDLQLSKPETVKEQQSSLHTPADLWVHLSGPSTKQDSSYSDWGRSFGDWSAWGEEGKCRGGSPKNYVARFQICEVLGQLQPKVATLEWFLMLYNHQSQNMCMSWVFWELALCHNSMKCWGTKPLRFHQHKFLKIACSQGN